MPRHIKELVVPLVVVSCSHGVGGPSAVSGFERNSSSQANHSLVCASKVRRAAAAAMGVTGAGESRPVVPRRLRHTAAIV